MLFLKCIFKICRFENEKKLIEAKYDEIERALIQEFETAQRKDDFKTMKDLANVLSNFKGYSHCIDTYIEHSQAVSIIK